MNSLRRQLTRALLGALSVLLGAALVAIALVVRRELVGAFDSSLRVRATAVGALAEASGGGVELELPPEFLRGFGGARPRNFFELWDESGKRLARSPSVGEADLPRRVAGRGEQPLYENLTLPSGRPGRAIGFTMVLPAADGAPTASPAAAVQLVVAADAEDLQEALAGLVASVAGCGVLLFAAVWLVVPRVLRRGLAPLDALGEQVACINAESLGAQLSVGDLPAELRPVGDRLNDLLARLAASFERERRFSADLAHELRTPLAELRSLAECALKWPEARDPATDGEVLAIAKQLEALVTRLLTLTRGERGQLAAELTPVAPAVLAAEAWRPLAARAAARDLRPEFSLAPAMVPADPVLLRGILQNLFDNAVAYAPLGSVVRVTGTAVAGGYVLRCANLAGDLAAADVARLFERFWRKEAARSGGGEHLGLGLSLARAFATAMGWRLTATLEADGWLIFTLESGAQ